MRQGGKQNTDKICIMFVLDLTALQSAQHWGRGVITPGAARLGFIFVESTATITVLYLSKSN